MQLRSTTGVTCGLFVVAAIAAGLLLDPTGFLGNLLAEGVGVLASVVVAVAVVERLLERERHRRWETIADATYDTVRWVIAKAGLRLYMVLPAPRPVDADPFSGHESSQLASALGKLARAFDELDGEDVDAPAVMAEVQTNFDELRRTLTPRLVALGSDPALVAALMAWEATLETLQYDTWLDERFGLPAHFFLADVAVCIRALQDVVIMLGELEPGAAPQPVAAGERVVR